MPSIELEIKKENFLHHQFEFLIADDPIVALVSGFGAGKTYGFLRKVLINHIYNVRDVDDKSNGWVLYPTLDLAAELFVEDFKILLEDFDIEYNYNSSVGRFSTAYGWIKIYTLEQPNRMVGANLTYVGIDEFDTVKPSKALECFRKAIGRLRGCENPKLFIVTTPEGFRATYHIFIENPKPSQKIIYAKTIDNPYLPKTYIDLLKEQYDPKLLEAYMNGKFVNLTSGTVYYSFDREKHVRKNDLEVQNNIPINFCFDFNVFPYSVSWNQILNHENIVFLGEWVSKSHSNTDEACLEIIKLLPADADVVIYGDASGRNGAANSNVSNYQIIDSIFKNYFKSVSYKVPTSNPAVRDRINCVNNKISKNHVTFNKSCVKLILDHEQVVWNEKGNEIDKSNILRTHSTDGSGYFFWVEYPIVNFRKETITKSY
jgi:hypothetical protein